VDKVDTVVIGAGLMGLAVARALASAGREVLILEAEDAIGTHTSSRNSEVIHAGIYYPQGSVKARACVEGRQRLYAYCAERGVPHRRCGKLIVATDPAQAEELERVRQRAHANGVTDVERVSAAKAGAMEPELHCVSALHSPSTGIVDSHRLMLAYLGDAERAGAMLALKTTFEKCLVRARGIELHVACAEPILATQVVNSAGLRAPSVARCIEGYPAELAPPEFYAKGNYFTLSTRSPFSSLVYPVPEPGGLGVHLTLDLGGRARFGPDVEWVDRVDYTVDSRRAERFYTAIRRYWPGLPEGALEPGYAGIRPKISDKDAPAADFVVQGPRAHGVPGLVNLFGIESPGLTASLPLADAVVSHLTAPGHLSTGGDRGRRAAPRDEQPLA
jgi:L-2-hydroxyglutarate oxidase LhgO